VFHVVLTGLQVANAASHYVPPPYNVILAGVGAIVQGVVALKNHKAVVNASGQ